MDTYWSKLAYGKQDISQCEQEAIRQCGAIQPEGFFVAYDAQSEIIQVASENSAELLGIDPHELIGKKIKDVLSFSDNAIFTTREAEESSRIDAVRLVVKSNNKNVLGSFLRSGPLVGIDLEYVRQNEAVVSNQFVQELKRLVYLVDSENNLEAILGRAVDQLRKITKFDRLMIYRFESNWDGHVIAESKESSLEPFLGLYYPSTDIPEQARKLYFETKYRMIIDTHSEPAKLLTNVGLGRSEIDLTNSAYRAVSPFHMLYLKNMGVRASFSVPLKVNGKLWGLISCHHYNTPMHLSRELRSICELAGQVISGRLMDFISDRRLRIKNNIYELSQTLLSHVTQGNLAIQAFKTTGHELLSLTDSSGIYVRIAGEEAVIGDTPDPAYINQIVQELRKKDSLTLFETTRVSETLHLPVNENAVGVMAVPFSIGFEDLLIWFRPEFVHEIKWGGKPTLQDGKKYNLEPRASFAAWAEVVKGHSREWSDADLETAQSLLFTFVQGIFTKASDLSNANNALQRATKAKDEFIGMVSHELRTPLGVMIGWIDILRDQSSQNPMIQQALEVIDRNAKLQINLINDLLDISRIISGKMRISPEANVNVTRIIQDIIQGLTPTADAKNIQLQLDAQENLVVSVDPERLRQVIWNLLTNSIKFTAKGGTVQIILARENSSYKIEVRDNGIGIAKDQLQAIFDRFAQAQEGHARMGGLGLGLSIVKSLVEMHGGVIEAKSDGPGKGASFIARFPIFALKQEAKAVPTEAFLQENFTRVLEGMSVLIAEDQPEAAQALEHNLKRAGGTVTIANNGLEAYNLVRSRSFDLLLSDIGMPQMDGYQLIRKIRDLETERRTTHSLPAIALTAHATSQDRAKCLEFGFQNHIAKPIDRNELFAVIKSLNVKKRT